MKQAKIVLINVPSCKSVTKNKAKLFIQMALELD